jgi:AbrB family looped-hinge helix DNA binding protein
MYHKTVDSHEPTHATSLGVVTVQLGDRGRLVVPAGVRRRLGLKLGDRFLLKVEADGSMRLINIREAVQGLCGIYAHIAPGRSLVDELIEERRCEAEREDAE